MWIPLDQQAQPLSSGYPWRSELEVEMSLEKKEEMETGPGRYHFLLIGGTEMQMQWSLALQQALSPLGILRIVPEEEAVRAVTQDRYDAAIIDAGAVHDAILLISRVRAQQPELRIVVATASPTWHRAREAFLAGAADYVRKSLNVEKLLSTLNDILIRKRTPWPR